jgi:cobalt transporter subunit CbtA
MVGRVLLAALLAGIAAGLIMGAIQEMRLTPLILAAETYEAGGAVPAGVDAGPGRSLLTAAATAMAGAAFAAILAGISFLAGITITPRNGAVWGLCGFLAATLAPAAGLPPELPGMAAGDLVARQVWWLATIVATGAGLYLIAARREAWAIVAAVVLIAAPHIVGAPAAASHESPVPAALAAAFAANAIAAGAVFWCLIGLFLGLALERLAGREHRR